MKVDGFVLFLLFLFFVGGLVVLLNPESWEEPEIAERRLCIEKGGVPIMNWNATALKRCDFPPAIPQASEAIKGDNTNE